MCTKIITLNHEDRIAEEYYGFAYEYFSKCNSTTVEKLKHRPKQDGIMQDCTEKLRSGNGYVGGDSNNTPCLVQGLIRSGRTQEVKTKMLHELSSLVAKITELDEKRVTVDFLEG
ncbi:unnamed protein product [Didymodactylos carnosus]|uniref:Uncharacterized protein n=1 Tax=Didymodactylos carnosus TaxID=1234261 RepID=A0A814U1D2_9BILA|nr:unnamed protein product [Didymodactylos carnosus]CAF3929406.1 unnamed protein product [Didymodactylos carnosus]